MILAIILIFYFLIIYLEVKVQHLLNSNIIFYIAKLLNQSIIVQQAFAQHSFELIENLHASFQYYYLFLLIFAYVLKFLIHKL
jgi:hypothetical protein